MTIICISSFAFAGCDIYGECREDNVVKAVQEEIPKDASMPPQPKPAKALDASGKPQAERATGTIGGNHTDKKIIKLGTIGGPRPDAICVDKGDATECH